MVRRALWSLLLLAAGCSTPATATDAARQPDEFLAAGREQLTHSCTTADAGPNWTPADRLGESLAGWSTLRRYDVPAPEVEGARACACNLAVIVAPSEVSTDERRLVGEACCARDGAMLRAWCQ